MLFWVASKFDNPFLSVFSNVVFVQVFEGLSRIKMMELLQKQILNVEPKQYVTACQLNKNFGFKLC